MKVLLFDIETSPNIGYTWQKWDQNVIAFKKEWEMLSFAYKWLGESKVYCVTREGKKSDKDLVKKLHTLLSSADIVIAHNGDAFDVKKAHAKFIEHGFAPPTPFKSVDTRSIARRYFKFNSNSLDDLGNLLGVGRKMKHSGFDLWLGCMNNEPKAWAEMAEYNKQDVLLLERVYLKMRPWIRNHPNVGSLLQNCPKCSGSLKRRGTVTQNSGVVKQRYQCRSCHGWHLGKLAK